MNATKENDYTCGTCKYWNGNYAYCWKNEDYYNVDETCDGWIDDNEPDLTEEERYDGGCMSNFDNENPKEVEDYINEDNKD